MERTASIETLEVGDLVKISIGFELFWIEVIEITENKIKGRIDKDLGDEQVSGLKFNGSIELNETLLLKFTTIKKKNMFYGIKNNFKKIILKIRNRLSSILVY